MADADYSPPDNIPFNGRNIAFDAVKSAYYHLEVEGVDGSPSSPTQASNFVPVDLSWRDLTFDVPVKVAKEKTVKPDTTDDKEEEMEGLTETLEIPNMLEAPGSGGTRKRVLRDCSGEVKAGQFISILGSSGAGKSTLLNLLAGRIETSKGCEVGGAVLVNGKKRDFNEFKKIAAYVEQDDSMFAELTVEEQITYSALLRLPSTMTKEQKLLRVESVIQELGLSKARKTKIGSELIRGVSGGERKRVSIGTELVSDPSLIIADEPTTGLDAFNALNVMTSLRQLASNGRTVVTTIHQPRSSIFALFDLLLLLSEGRTVYFGPARDAASYFANIGFRSPPNFNLADYVIDAVSIDYRSKALEARTKKRVLYMADELTSYRSDAIAAIEENRVGSREVVPKESQAAKTYQNNYFAEFSILLRRMFTKLSRENQTNIQRVVQAIVFSLLLGLIWLGLGRNIDDLDDRTSILGAVFFLGAQQGFDGAFSVIFDFPLERAVIQRERSSGSYRTSTYWLASLVVSLVKGVVVNFVFVVIVYWMVGLRANAGAFFYAVLAAILLGQIGEAYSQSISVFTGSAQISAALVPLVIVLSFLFAGFFITAEAMPAYIRWGRFASFLYWGYEALAANEFDTRTDPVSLEIGTRFNEFDRWGNFGFLVLFCVAAKLVFLGALYVRRPKFDSSL